jgi:CHAT domain
VPSRLLARACPVAVVLLILVWPAAPASAQTVGNCVAEVNDVNVNNLSHEGVALEVDVDESVLLEGLTPNGTTFLRVAVGVPVGRVTVFDRTFSSERELWAVSTDVSEHAVFGTGLYQIVAFAEDCRATAWVKVTGRSPFTTVAGVSATAAIIAGLAISISGLFAARRTGRGLARAICGGLLVGAGALVLAQQLGRESVTWSAVATWLTIPGGISGVSHLAIAAVRGPGPAPLPSDQPVAPTQPQAQPEAPPEPPHQPEAPTEIPSEPQAPPESGAEPTGPPATREAELEPAREGSEDPPRSAHARLECPDVVVAEREFALTVGLAPEPTPGVAGGPLVRPASSVGPYILSVQVVADGFRLTRGGAWRQDLAVTARSPYPAVVLYLAADPATPSIRAGTIQAMFSVDGQTMGLAVRSVAVVATEDLIGQAQVSPEEAGTDITIPTARVAPDLTVRILFGESESEGRLLWTFETPYLDVDLPDAPVGTDVGGHPEAFAGQLVDRVGSREGQPGLYQYLTGIGYTVADQVPTAFWDVLRAVAARTPGRSPTLLILSQEPYVPWELAVVDPPLDPSLPPFLSAQCTVGRWVLGRRRPKLPPPVEVQVQTLAVLWGVYQRSEWRLLEAEDEAAQIRQVYGALSVNADAESVLGALQGSPRADLLHFAMHGVYDPAGPQEGLVLLDGQTLDPMQVRGSRLDGAPFVFINACQVGSGKQVLGDYAGVAEAFLYAGASGVVAPLWSIGDTEAKEIALRFYERTLRQGAGPAEVFRTERAAFRDADQPVSSTYLAYQFFGHPAMKLLS